MTDSEKNLSQSTLQQFDDYKSLISAEIELIQRILEIRQNFSNSSDLERIIEPIMQRIHQIRDEKSIIEKNLNLF
ncbi:hypothetical protein [Nitrosopumilus sp. Nsub]|uniref:hypothetical protein n=1 Tax=Nitrosopumilus sp. Nsub TaxID=1776294 RepID=UPI000831F0F7|nr:hypothetical protein [Nitrosopumilus sp. Nsub]